jgi:hypothetical protein
MIYSGLKTQTRWNIPSKEINDMNTTTKTPLVIALVVVTGLFLRFGIGAMTGTMMNGGWMGTGWTNGNGMMGSGWMGGISWMWIPTVLTLGFGVLLGWVLFGKRGASVKNE